MTHVNGSLNGHQEQAPTVTAPAQLRPQRVSPKRMKQLEGLSLPFEASVIQWRVVETARVSGTWRGRVIPYADILAYLQRLNDLLTPMGWSSTVTVHQTMHSPSDRNRALPGKVVVSCQLTIHGLGSHSSTGEEWATDDTAVTSAEAQAFKRACARFGLGAYLYYFFRGVWVDLDPKKHLLTAPALPEWATPQGWRSGSRPSIERKPAENGQRRIDASTIQQIESMRNELGIQVYRGMLKNHRIWEPKQISNPEVAVKILADMKLAHDLMLRVSAAMEQIGKPAFAEIIKSHNLKSVSDFGDLETLQRLVAAVEAKAKEAAIG